MASKIIVATTLHKEYGTERCTARLEGLGLTGYGTTMLEAESSVKDLFNEFIREYRRLGVLEDRLTNHFKVAWWPIDEYDGELEIEDTSPDDGEPERESTTQGGQGANGSKTEVAWQEAA